MMKSRHIRHCSVWVLLALLSAGSTIAAADAIEDKWGASPHSNAASESFTHWDEEGKIPLDCAACHSSSGFQDYLGADGSSFGKVDKEHATGTVIDCNACHNAEVKSLDSVTFPSGAVIGNIESSAQCLVCHQGRSSTPAVNRITADTQSDKVNPELGFINIHYRAAAASLYGAEVQGGYEYSGKNYATRFAHVEPLNSCTGCHDAHSLRVDAAQCSGCHQADQLSAIRTSTTDFDGNGDTSEGIAAEINELHTLLGAAIVVYGRDVAKAPVLYSAHNYPYFFNDNNADSIASDDEVIFPNRYRNWTPRMLKAAYNYQFVAKDPGGYAHNPDYLLQLMYDSLADLSGKISYDMSSLARP